MLILRICVGAQGDPVLFLENPQGVDAGTRRAMLNSLTKFNALAHARHRDPETLTRIAQYEMAFRMQASVPELTDIAPEPQAVLDLYGPEVRTPGSRIRAGAAGAVRWTARPPTARFEKPL